MAVVTKVISLVSTSHSRYMLALAGVPGIIQFIGFIYLPESPRWLVMKGKDEQAIAVLRRIRGKEDVHVEINEIKEVIEDDKKNEGKSGAGFSHLYLLMLADYKYLKWLKIEQITSLYNNSQSSLVMFPYFHQNKQTQQEVV